MQRQSLPILAFVGGFLGAGKTTLILKAAELLAKSGRRAAFITNDQDTGLVDTEHARTRDLVTREIAGGCLCCRFSDLVDAFEALTAFQPDVVFAEPVGSCVDISATILQPLKAYHRDRYQLAPLTVLIDSLTAEKVYSQTLDRDIEFLFQHQIAEADLICLTKQDLATEPIELPFPVDFRLSATRGDGVKEWLDEILSSSRLPGAQLLTVNYRRYAEAEAALGWLNLYAEVRLWEPLSPAMLCGPFFESLQTAMQDAGLLIAHLKLFDQCATGWLKVSLSANGLSPIPEGELLAQAVHQHQLALNLRAIADPALLRALVEEAVAKIPGKVRIGHFTSFRPAPPRPEHRFSEVQP